MKVKDTHLVGQPIFKQLINFIPREKIEAQVHRHQSDRYYKFFSSWTQLVSMLFGILSRCDSSGEVTDGMRALEGKLNHLGMESLPAKSTFGDGLRKRDNDFFQEINFMLLEHYTVYTIIVGEGGSGGNGGNPGQNGEAGGTSSVGSLISATGGSGGIFYCSGGTGGTSAAASNAAGANGGASVNGCNAFSGNGGAGGGSVQGCTTGIAGSSPGGRGSGSSGNCSTPYFGGKGGPGKVIITW